jgi:anti-sigma factor RsiW
VSDHLTPEELESLLGAYALDAVSDDERVRVEEHLRTSPRAAAEVAAYREVLAQLHTEEGIPPPALWDRIAASLEERPPPLRLEVVRERRGRRGRRPPGWTIATIAAGMLLLGGLLGLLASQWADSNGDSLAAQVDHARSDPTVRQVALASADKSLLVNALIAADGGAWLEARDLPALDAGHTYQLWGLRDGTPVSLGLLGRDPMIVTFRADGPFGALAVTAEAAGGATAPTTTPVVSGEI